MKYKKGVIIGRFQPVHKGHVEGIRRALRECGMLVIVIGSAQEERTERNPLSAGERRRMLEGALDKLMKRIKIVEVADTFNNTTWIPAVLEKVGKADVLYSNNSLVRRLLKPYLKVKWLASGIRINSTRIRVMIKKGDVQWRKWIPAKAFPIVEKMLSQ